MIRMTEEINDILNLGYALATEPYFKRLIDILLDGCMKFTSADSGLVYLMVREQLKLANCACINKTLDKRHESYEAPDDMIDLRAQNMMAFAASHKEIQFVDDIYAEKHFDTLSIKEFDQVHSYRTGSIMVIPIYDPDKKIMGVMQLINCMENGMIVPFPRDYAKLVSSLVSQMAVTLTNINKYQEFDELLDSFVNCMTTAIDARTPYNANHTRNVAAYCMEVVAYINSLHTRGEYREFITEEDREQLNLAARLHDLGKMITPRNVLNKSTRLGDRFDALIARLEKIKLLQKIDMLEGRMDSAEWAMADLRLDNFIGKLPDINIKERLEESEVRKIMDMSGMVYTDPEGHKIPYLTEDEVTSLSITRGTLTAQEREIVQQHVVFTDKMLDEIKFSAKYNRVQQIASRHHEFLDGSGYPNHLTAENLDNLTRILTIVDIYESLTSTDRPYKGIMPTEKALSILASMANEGKLDKELTRIICNYMAEKNGVTDWNKNEQ